MREESDPFPVLSDFSFTKVNETTGEKRFCLEWNTNTCQCGPQTLGVAKFV